MFLFALRAALCEMPVNDATAAHCHTRPLRQLPPFPSPQRPPRKQANSWPARRSTGSRQPQQMDSVPVEKENATGNVAAPSKTKPIVKSSSQDGTKPRAPLRMVAAPPQEHVAVRAVSAAHKRMLDRQPTASITPAAKQGRPMCLSNGCAAILTWLFCSLCDDMLTRAHRAAASQGRGGIFCRLFEG